jgi:beta-mannosidase
LTNNHWKNEDLCGEWHLGIIADADFQKMSVSPKSVQAVRASGMAVIPASVPGNFELDLTAAGKLEDPFYGGNILQLQELEDRHLFYFRKFRVSPAENTIPILRFEGIDTVADVFVNGDLAGHAENMFIPHEFELPAAQSGENELVIHILPSVLEAAKQPSAAGNLSLSYCEPTMHLRKAAHSFAWDIAPRAVSGGLWRPVSLIYRPEVRIDELYLYTERLNGGTSARMGLFYRVCAGDFPFSEMKLHCVGVCGDSRFETEIPLWFSSGTHRFTVSQPLLWQPKGSGQPSLYEVEVTLKHGGEVLDRKTFKTGIRTVRLVRKESEVRFRFDVNGLPIFVLGSNWVPADAFHSRDPERIGAILDMAEDLGCNMLRCWGGNVYEDDLFFDQCDERGLMVWQDFAMACGTYPQDERMSANLRLEAEAVVKKLRSHPSLCLWAGDNECDQVYAPCNGIRRNPNQNILTRKVLPEVLFSHDPTRPYLPSSPYIDEADYQNGSRDLPEDHVWGVRDYFKGDYYRNISAAFASEVGYHGCPSPQSVERFISPDCLWPCGNDEWLLHAASPETTHAAPYAFRISLMEQQISTLFGRDMRNLPEFALASQISQAEAMKFFIESFRIRKGDAWGIIWWNLCDCWPQFSDAVTDYYFVKKLAYHFIKTSQLPVAMLFGEPKNGQIPLFVSNLTQSTAEVSYRVLRAGKSDEVVLAEGKISVHAGATPVAESIPEDAPQAFYMADWQIGERGFRNHFLAGAPPYSFEWVVGCMERYGLLPLEGFDNPREC